MDKSLSTWLRYRTGCLSCGLIPSRGICCFPLRRLNARSRRPPEGLFVEVLTAQPDGPVGHEQEAIVRALEDDQLVSTEDTAAIRSRRVNDLMAEAGLTEQWRALCAGRLNPCGSPWLVNRALEAYSHGWVGAHVVADLLGQDVETTRASACRSGMGRAGRLHRLAARCSRSICRIERSRLQSRHR